MAEYKVLLVVDDNLENRKLIGVFLKGLPVQVVEAPDALKALDYLNKHKVDLMLLDLSMPIMSGIELCRIIREDERFAGLPVVAYTANATNQEKQQLLAKGFNDLLAKPITRNHLINVIKFFI